MNDRVIELTTVSVGGIDVDVSTVDLGDIGPRGYETMLFVDSVAGHPLHHRLIGRYSNAEEARLAHRKAVADLHSGEVRP